MRVSDDVCSDPPNSVTRAPFLNGKGMRALTADVVEFVPVHSGRSNRSLQRTLPSDEERRSPPHNLKAEQALLGAILVHNEAYDRVSGFLEPHHFYDPLHQQIYETAARLIEEGKCADPITLKQFASRAGSTEVGHWLRRAAISAPRFVCWGSSASGVASFRLCWRPCRTNRCLW
jgi:hypothetical protein